MAEYLKKSSHDNNVNYDTDEEDDYEEFCEKFTFSVGYFHDFW